MSNSKDKTNEQSKALETFISLFNGINNNKSDDDQTFRTKAKEQITDRDVEYTNLLKHFVLVTKVRNILKEFFKWIFFIIIAVCMIVLASIIYKLFGKYIKSADIKDIVESMPLLISGIAGFVSAIIAIPVAITKYLFSIKEDENITKIILHTQDHDIDGRKWTMDFIKSLPNNTHPNNPSSNSNNSSGNGNNPNNNTPNASISSNVSP